VRLERLKEESSADIEVSWKGYPLVTGDMPGRRFTGYLANAWARAHEEEPSLTFQPWAESAVLPSSSLPALEAAKCVELQEHELFPHYHMALFRAFFEQCRDISNREIIISIAEEVGLDVAQLARDLDSGKGEKLLLADYKGVKQSGSISGVPLAMFPGGQRLEGAVPLELYRRAVEVTLKNHNTT
jgi:predicted DsbA family dithiol-disulfide isomerase